MQNDAGFLKVRVTENSDFPFHKPESIAHLLTELCMLTCGAHLVGSVSASVLLQKSFACHPCVVPILIIRSFGFPET